MLNRSNEKLIAITLVIEENLNFSINFILSQFIPSNVVFSSNKFLFKSYSIFLGCNKQFLIKVLNFGEFRNSAIYLLNILLDTLLQLIRQFRFSCQQQIKHRNLIILSPLTSQKLCQQHRQLWFQFKVMLRSSLLRQMQLQLDIIRQLHKISFSVFSII